MKFVDIDKEDELSTAPAVSHVGVVLFSEDGSWHALRPGTGYSKEGAGAPEGLEPGLWIVDRKYEDVRSIHRRTSGSQLRSDTWLRMTVEKLRAAWGVDKRPEKDAIKVVAGVSDRIFRLVQEAVEPNLGNMNFRTVRDALPHLERPNSLATGIAEVNSGPLKWSSSSDKRVIEHFSKAWQAGMFIGGRREEEGSALLSFAFPRLSYALSVAAPQVPGQSIWQVAGRGDDMETDEFFRNAMDLGRPSIFRAICRPASEAVPEYAQAFANSRGGSDAYRTRFISEEITALSRWYDISIESVVCGQEWIDSATGRLLRSLEEAAGGPQAARASWSVGLAAENILASAFRKTRDSGSGETGEAVWIAARDRAAMMPAVSALYDVGASLVSAYLGNITVRCPLDPELLMSVLETAWAHGLSLPFDEVRMLVGQGVVVPHEASRFGGKDVDYLLSSIAHMRRRKALWALDKIQDEPGDQRSELFRRIIS